MLRRFCVLLWLSLLANPTIYGKVDNVPFDGTGKSFIASHQVALEEVEKELQSIESFSGPRTIENTLIPFRQTVQKFSNAYYEAYLFANAHPDKSIRDKAFAAVQRFAKMESERFLLNPKLFQALNSLDPKEIKQNTELSNQLADLLREYRRAGIDKGAVFLDNLQKLDAKINKTASEFSKNLTEDVRVIYVRPESLEGLPKDYIENRRQKNGLIKITSNYPDTRPVSKYAKSPAVRRQVYLLGRQRGFPKNVEPLKALLELRREKANMLGYKSWAHYSTETKMSGSPQKVIQFLDDVKKLSYDTAMKDYNLLLAEKRRDFPSAKNLAVYDSAYYENLYKKECLIWMGKS